MKCLEIIDSGLYYFITVRKDHLDLESRFRVFVIWFSKR